MAKKFLIAGVFVTMMFFGVSCGFAEKDSSLFWYRVRILDGQTSYSYVGSSPLDESNFIKKLGGGSYILLENLVYFDQTRKAKDFTEWDPTTLPRIYINPKYISAVLPLDGAPREK